MGAGIHGTHVAARLVEEAGLDPDDLTLLDPADRPLAAWHACTQATGMQYLRSPSVHHLGLEPFELLRFGASLDAAPCGATPFAPPYNRPAVSLFHAHADAVIARTGIGERHHVGRARRVHLDCDAARVELADGSTMTADNVVLALGVGEQPRWPGWARALAASGAAVSHLFDAGANPRPEAAGDPAAASPSVAVIGAGISGVQLAMRLASQANPLVLVSGHPLQTHQFDSDPGWLGPRFMAAFTAEPDPDRRRATIQAARHPGSIPPALAEALQEAIDEGRIVLHAGPVDRAARSSAGIHLHTTTGEVIVDRVVLATGFEPRRPGGRLLDELIESTDLPCASCGYPVVDAQLRWHPRLFLTGALAELEIGPSARNIAGARRAAARLVETIG